MIESSRIFSVADQLMRSGTKPSVRTVRKALGRGSHRDIAPALKLWWSERLTQGDFLSRRVSTEGRVENEVPRETPRKTQGEKGEIDVIREQLEAERRHLMLETDRLRQSIKYADGSLQRKIDALESDNLYLKSKIAALERRVK